ncbi:hypothetical protein [Paenibacillus pini]|uniref:Uncharacterized protein n=1 Tax=Paenibacillus pini JCM 16418 TaxID=1236976 RepID=W7YSI5_9BACL|nr:hypothetical protein [Paenibacillus pini]GAF07586.1 hypothetical protein JCM16418_1613 [Paenibacillus pini JCM 16418]
MVARKPVKRKLTAKQQEKKSIEFSKIILAMVMSTYFAGVLLGGYIVFHSSSELSALLTFIGAPVATAIGFYYWKAKNENVSKHTMNRIENTEGDEQP